jgi:hypothetical protein
VRGAREGRGRRGKEGERRGGIGTRCRTRKMEERRGEKKGVEKRIGIRRIKSRVEGTREGKTNEQGKGGGTREKEFLS